eukprot:265602-Prymnesium_polylepis.1
MLRVRVRVRPEPCVGRRAGLLTEDGIAPKVGEGVSGRAAERDDPRPSVVLPGRRQQAKLAVLERLVRLLDGAGEQVIFGAGAGCRRRSLRTPHA